MSMTGGLLDEGGLLSPTDNRSFMKGLSIAMGCLSIWYCTEVRKVCFNDSHAHSFSQRY